MTIDRDALYKLLPSVYRERDGQAGEPFRALLEVLTDELVVMGDGIDQLYDDLFIETAAPWVLPYLAELIGLRGLPSGSATGIAPRAEIANTVGYRRRKGTAAVIEQVARDVTGWPARAVEFFELLAATQHMNHVRPGNLAVANIRDADRLSAVASPFERLSGRADLVHTVDVRRIASRRGFYNIPNLGIFLWRMRAYSLTNTPCVPVQAGDKRRFHLHPLGISTPIYTLPETEDEITHAAEPINVPRPMSRRALSNDVMAIYEKGDCTSEYSAFYGPKNSLLIDQVSACQIDVCDLQDVTDSAGVVTGWAHTPVASGRVAVDPVLGRVAFGDDQEEPRASFHYGFSANIGGGEYDRAASFDASSRDAVLVSNGPDSEVPVLQTVEEALGLVADGGVVEIRDSSRYGFAPLIVANGKRIEVRAADLCRPTIVLEQDLVIDGDSEGEVTLNGLLITGGRIVVRNVGSVRLLHSTLVPGLALDAGLPVAPGTPSLIIESATTAVTIDRCILGPVRVNRDAEVSVVDSIVDATEEGVAYASSGDETEGGGKVRFEQCTVFGKIHARILELASNSIFAAAVTETDDPLIWPGPVIADRRQEGCVRFSYLPTGSRTPRRHHCQPSGEHGAGRVRPMFTSERFSDAGYCQLDRRTPDEIWRGADDSSEMGAFHHLFQPQRESYLELRLNDYLRFGLEAGVFFAS